MFEKYENYRFPNKDFYEYSSNYKNNDFNIIGVFISLFILIKKLEKELKF